MFCAIWCHFYNLKNVKNTHGGVLLLVKLLKVTLLHGFFHVFTIKQMVPYRATRHNRKSFSIFANTNLISLVEF